MGETLRLLLLDFVMLLIAYCCVKGEKLYLNIDDNMSFINSRSFINSSPTSNSYTYAAPDYTVNGFLTL